MTHLRSGGPQDAVFRFEECDALHQLGNLLLEHFDFFANGEHQMTLDQIHGLFNLVVDGHRTAPAGAAKSSKADNLIASSRSITTQQIRVDTLPEANKKTETVTKMRRRSTAALDTRSDNSHSSPRGYETQRRPISQFKTLGQSISGCRLRSFLMVCNSRTGFRRFQCEDLRLTELGRWRTNWLKCQSPISLEWRVAGQEAAQPFPEIGSRSALATARQQCNEADNK